MNEERKRDDEDEISITDASLDENEADVRSDKKHSFLWLRGVFNGIKQSLFLAALILVPAMVINMCSVNTEVAQHWEDKHYSWNLSLLCSTSKVVLWGKGVQFIVLMMMMTTIASTFLYFKCAECLEMRLRPLFPSPSSKENFPGQSKGDVNATRVLLCTMVFFFVLLPVDIFYFKVGISLMDGVYYDIAGLVFIIGGYIAQIAVFIENKYAIPYASNRAQPDQKVVTTGLYRFVRHPMYSSLLIFAIGCSMFFGSYLSMLAVNVLAVSMVPRILEEEKALKGYLEGYDKYCKEVKNRLVPGIW